MPLHDACREGHLEVVRFLIQEKSNVNALTNLRNSPLHLASRNGHFDIIKLLVGEGANIYIKNKMGQTPLDVASKHEVRQFLQNVLTAPQTSFQTPPSQQELHEFNLRWLKAVNESNCNDLASLLQQAKQKRLPFNINVKNKTGYTALHVACWENNLELARLLIEAKASVNERNKDGHSPLHLTCMHGNAELVTLLIEAKAYINVKNITGDTPLHLSSSFGHSNVVKSLIDAGALIEALDNKSRTPLDVATTPEIRQLLENARAAQQASLQPPPSQQEIDQFHRNWVAALSEKNCPKLLSLLQQARQLKIPCNLDVKSKAELSALHLACRQGHSELVKLLIESKADLNVRDKNKGTPLHEACFRGHLQEAELLIAAGADINATSKYLHTPLHDACENGHSEVVKLLIKAKANIDCLTKYGNSPLHIASDDGNSDIVEQLLAAGALTDGKNNKGHSSLHNACIKGHLQAANLLIKAGADINAIGKYQHTPLHDACENRHSEVVKLLIEAKANIDCLTKYGNSPLHIASDDGNSDIVEQLLAAGAIIDGKNKDNQTPLDRAKTPEIRALLEDAQRAIASRPAAPSQSRAPTLKKIEQAGQKLLKRIAAHYGPRFHAELTKVLIKNRGRWGIDFARYSSQKLSKSEWLAPFVQFLEAHPGSNTASQVVKQQLAFFQFSDSSDSEVLTDDLSSAESFVEKCLKENVQPPRGGQVPLSDYFAKEACQTLFSLKLREWNYMVNHPERYFQGSERREDASAPRCPCFILAQDKNQVRAHIMQAHFGTIGFIESFGKDVGQEALRFLFTEVLKYSRVPSERIREDESVILSWQEYNILERYLAELPPSDLPRLLVPMREKLIQPIEELSETDSSGDDTESASDEETSYQRG
ncbi:MAG: ankyrin repeat domain-containing protein, partial [Pseudobdellovibrionaceae bacterium]